MIIYNITISVDHSIESDWLNWIEKTHIPNIMSSGLFISANLQRVVTNFENDNTFAIAFKCNSKKKFEDYQSNFASSFQEEHFKRYSEKVTTFSTMLEVLIEF